MSRMNRRDICRKRRTPETEKIEALLRPEFPVCEAYRYNAGAIRVRVVDPRFVGKSISERDALVSPILAQLPEHEEREISMLLMLTPEEMRDDRLDSHSWANREFDDPSPSSFR